MPTNEETTTRPLECESCNFPTDALTYYRRTDYDPILHMEDYRGIWSCELCTSTMTLRAQDHPDRFPEALTLRAICRAGGPH